MGSTFSSWHLLTWFLNCQLWRSPNINHWIPKSNNCVSLSINSFYVFSNYFFKISFQFNPPIFCQLSTVVFFLTFATKIYTHFWSPCAFLLFQSSCYFRYGCLKVKICEGYKLQNFSLYHMQSTMQSLFLLAQVYFYCNIATYYTFQPFLVICRQVRLSKWKCTQTSSTTLPWDSRLYHVHSYCEVKYI
jgi:hypothetical protein